MSGRRPMVVLTRDAAIGPMRRVVVAPCTTNVRGLPTEVLLEPGEDPVPQVSVVSLDSVLNVPLGVLVERLGRLSDDRMRQVCAALAAAVDCPALTAPAGSVARPELGLQGGRPTAGHPLLGDQGPQVGQHGEAGRRVEPGIHIGVDRPHDAGDVVPPGAEGRQDLPLPLGPMRQQGGDVGLRGGDRRAVAGQVGPVVPAPAAGAVRPRRPACRRREG